VTEGLFSFRYRHPVSGRWVMARYKATREDIAARYVEWETIGPPEFRSAPGKHFSPYRITSHNELMRMTEQPPVINPHLLRPPDVDTVERFLVSLFLRRYVTYCARRNRLSAMQGAATLYRELVKTNA
jgi:hypothetical protein